MEANDGMEAMEALDRFQPQLILTDLGMPGMDGLELIKRLRTDPRTAHLPVVAITADPTGGAEERAREAGADAFITKPVELPSLLEQLRAVHH